MVNIAIKKPKKSGKEFYSCNGFFFLVLLALVDIEYRFLWVDVGSSRYSSDTQLFNCCKLKKKIENGTFGLPPPEPLEKETPLYHFFAG